MNNMGSSNNKSFDKYIELYNSFRELLGHGEDYSFVCAISKKVEKFAFIKTGKEIAKFVKEWNEKAQCYISVNSCSDTNKWINNENITYWCNVYIDIDPDTEKKQVCATDEEKQKALIGLNKVLEWLEKNNFKKGYYDDTGNGYRLILPIPKQKLDSRFQRSKLNKQYKTFTKLLSIVAETPNCEYKIDAVHDWKRFTGIPLTLNIKQVGRDRPQRLRKPMDPIPKRIEDQKLFNFILELKSEWIENLHKYIKRDKKLHSLLCGNIESYISRSEAELALVGKLVSYGFSNNEIFEIMNICTIGKWQEEIVKRNKQYCERTIKKARESQSEPEDNIADKIMNNIPFITIRETDEVLYYKDGAYNSYGDKIIAEEVQKLLKKVKTHKVNEIINEIRRKTYISISELNKNKNLIVLENGIFNLETNTFEDHDPKYFATVKIPVKFDENAKCPLIRKFLREIVDTDDISTLEELIGYCLLKEYPIQNAFMLVGDGGNGKSTFLQLLKSFLGKDAVTSISLQELENNRFAKANLFGKLANIYADLSSEALYRTGILKMLTGGDTLTAENKYGGFFNFINYAKLIFSCNEIPYSYDNSRAFFRRWMIIKFPNVFDNKADKQLIKKLTTKEELSGLFNLAISGLKRLLTYEHFTNEKSIDYIRDQYIRMSDKVQAFVWDIIDNESEDTFDKGIEKSTLYNIFREYCKLNKTPACSSKKFFSRFKDLCTIDERRARVDEKAFRVWVGIEVKDNKLPITLERVFSHEFTFYLTARRQSKGDDSENEKTHSYSSNDPSKRMNAKTEDDSENEKPHSYSTVSIDPDDPRYVLPVANNKIYNYNVNVKDKDKVNMQQYERFGSSGSLVTVEADIESANEEYECENKKTHSYSSNDPSKGMNAKTTVKQELEDQKKRGAPVVSIEDVARNTKLSEEVVTKTIKELGYKISKRGLLKTEQSHAHLKQEATLFGIDPPSILYIDIETSGTDPYAHEIKLIQLYNGKNEPLLIDQKNYNDPRIFVSFKALMENEDVLKVGHGIKFEYKFLKQKFGIEMRNLYDTLLVDYVLSGGNTKQHYDLESVAKRYSTNTKVIKHGNEWLKKQFTGSVLSREALEYAKNDVLVLKEIYEKQNANIDETVELENALIPVVAEMELRGIGFDTDRAKELDNELFEKLNNIKNNEIKELIKDIWNDKGLNGEVIFDIDKVADKAQLLKLMKGKGLITELKLTEKGNVSTRKEVLKEYDTIVTNKIVEYQSLKALKTTVIEGNLKRINTYTGRLHTNFYQHGTHVGRFTSKDPNLQNIPRSNEYRNLFIAGEGREIVSADYSQIHLRIMAELSQDPNMLDGFRNGLDMHRKVASVILMKPYNEITKQERNHAKAVNFGLPYGISSDGLRRVLKQNYKIEVSENEAKQYLENIRKDFPVLMSYLDQLGEEAIREGRVFAKSGRLIKIENNKGEGAIRRMGRNNAIIALEADIMKKALIEVEKALQGLDANLISTVHDELLVECNTKIVNEVENIVKETMEKAAKTWIKTCPITVELKSGRCWEK